MGEWRRKDAKCDDNIVLTHMMMIDNDLECLWSVIHEQDGPRALPDGPSGAQDGPPTPPKCSQQ